MRTRKIRAASLYLTTAAALASPALAQTADATLDTVIVTARRTEERLQDVPISITVFNQDQLTRRNVVSGAELATYTPSLTANTRMGANGTSYAIRGFTQEARTTASVGVYFADVVAPRGGNNGIPVGDGAGPGAFFDLQNVQVLKGPQGTLFGRNTTGGAVLLVPQKPTREFEGYVEGSLGNYDTKRLQAVVNLPLSEVARLRLGFDTYEQGGYIKNISGLGPSKFGDNNYTSLRGSLVVDVTPDLENYTILTYSRSYNTGAIGKITACSTSFPFGTLCGLQLARQANSGFYTIQNGTPDPTNVYRQFQAINTTTWHASDSLTVKNIFSYSRVKSRTVNEIFGVDWIIPQQFGPIPNTGALAGTRINFARINGVLGNQNNFTEELQFQGRAERLIWQAGAYYEQSNPIGASGTFGPGLISCSDPANFRCTDVLALLLRQPSVGRINSTPGEVSFRNMAVYGQATYDLTDRLKLTGGARYTWDTTRATAELVTYRFFQPNVPTAFCSLQVNNLSPTTPITNSRVCSVTNEQKSDKPTWVVSLDYKPSSDVLLYAKYARGYRQGSINFNAPPEYQSYGPEKVDTYELGAKTSFQGAVAGSFNVAAFYNDFSNQQLAVSLASSTNALPPTQAVINGGKSRIYGVELDASLSPFENFRFDASYAYLNTKLKTLTPVTTPPGSPFDVAQFGASPGSVLPFTPKHKASLTASYTLPLPQDLGAVSFGLNYSFSSSYVVVTTVGPIKSIGLVNANVDWKDVGGQPVDLSLYTTNLLGDDFYVGVADLRSSTGFTSYVLGQPRFYGMRLKYRFDQ